ncbi:MAG: N-acetyltransferase family protein [Granulosicoccus sp.]
MSAFVRLAEPRDIESICHLLHEKMNSKIPVARWRQLMTYDWLEDKPDFGRIVESDGQVLGFCGMVYANRIIGADERSERVVSMSSWYLDKSMRGKGLGKEMLESAISDPTLTYATLTNSRKPLGIVEALGFRALEDHRYVWKKTDTADSALKLVDDIDVIRAEVKPFQQKIINDMVNLPLKPVLVQHEGLQALLFFSIKRKASDILWFDVMYTSDRALLAQCAQLIANRILPDSASVFAADGRFLEGPTNNAKRESLPVCRYYVSNRVEPHEIDHLYSELQLLDLKLD